MGDANPASHSEATEKSALFELNEAGQMHRFHVSLMFGQLTVFLAATGLLLQQILAKSPSGDPLEPATARVVAGVGLAMSFVFLVHHERMGDYAHKARNRAMKLQDPFGMTLYGPADHKHWPKMSAPTPSRWLYIGACILWLVLLITGRVQ